MAFVITFLLYFHKKSSFFKVSLRSSFWPEDATETMEALEGVISSSHRGQSLNIYSTNFARKRITIIPSECQSCCYSAGSPPPCTRTGTRGSLHGTPPASATRRTQPTWVNKFLEIISKLQQIERGCLYSVVDCSNSILKPVQCSCCQNKSAGRGVEVVVGVADERATAPHAQSVRIISGIRGGCFE